MAVEDERAVLFGYAGDFVLIPCEVEVQTPCEVTGLYYGAGKVDFDTAVHHVADVVVVRCEAE